MKDAQSQIDISGWSILRFFAYGLVLACISDVPNTWGVAYHGAYALVGALLFATLFMPFRPALVLLLMLAMAGIDIVESGKINDAQMAYSTASIWQMRLGLIRPSWIVFGCMFWQFVKVRQIYISPIVKCAIIWFATVPIVTGLIFGGFFGDFALIEVVKDLKFGMMLIVSMVLFLSLFRKNANYLPLMLSVFVGTLLARHLIDLLYFLANFGPVIAEGISRGSADSAKGGVIFLVFFGAILIWVRKRLVLGSAITIPSILLLAAYSTRMLWVTFLLGVIVLLLLLGFYRSLFFIFIMALLTVGGGWALLMAHPESAEVVLARSKTITEGRPVDKFAVPVENNLISRIDPIRYGEILNVFDSLGRRNAYLWGAGYGGFYEDSAVDFPLTLIGSTSFPKYSIYTGRFYRAHNYLIHTFLKHGLVGLLLISALWLVPGYAVFRILRMRSVFSKGQPRMLHGIMLCLVAFLVTAIFQLYWSGKGLFINGMVIASCIEFARQYHGNTDLKFTKRTLGIRHRTTQ